MIDRARLKGADAVIGVSLDYEVIGSRGAMLLVTAAGTARTDQKDRLTPPAFTNLPDLVRLERQGPVIWHP